jgi:hypothetical protein
MPHIKIDGRIISLNGVIPLYRDPDVSNLIDAIAASGTNLNFAQRMYVVHNIETLKNLDVWNYIIANYLAVGSTLNSHKFNAKNPQNTDAAYRLFDYGSGNQPAHDKYGFRYIGGSTLSTFISLNQINSSSNFICASTSDPYSISYQSTYPSILGVSDVWPSSLQSYGLSDIYNIYQGFVEFYSGAQSNYNTSGLNGLGTQATPLTITMNTFSGKNIYMANGLQGSSTYVPNTFTSIKKITICGANGISVPSYRSVGYALICNRGFSDNVVINIHKCVQFGQKMRANF